MSIDHSGTPSHNIDCRFQRRHEIILSVCIYTYIYITHTYSVCVCVLQQRLWEYIVFLMRARPTHRAARTFIVHHPLRGARESKGTCHKRERAFLSLYIPRLHPRQISSLCHHQSLSPLARYIFDFFIFLSEKNHESSAIAEIY